MKAVFRPLLATAFVVVLVASAACGGSSTASKSSGTTATKSSGGGSSGGGSSSSALDPATGMPASFPKDFPQYPGARLTAAFYEVQGHTQSWIMGWQTLDSPQKVNDYMAANLNKGDWQVSGTFSGNGAFVFTMNRRSDTKFAGTLTIGQNNQKTRTEIALLLGNGK
jgi:hypothetical protein